MSETAFSDNADAAIRRVDNHWRRVKSLFVLQVVGMALVAVTEFLTLPFRATLIFGIGAGMLISCVNAIGLAICERGNDNDH